MILILWMTGNLKYTNGLGILTYSFFLFFLISTELTIVFYMDYFSCKGALSFRIIIYQIYNCVVFFNNQIYFGITVSAIQVVLSKILHIHPKW